MLIVHLIISSENMVQMHVTVRSDAKISLKGEGEGNVVVLRKEEGGSLTFSSPTGNMTVGLEEGEVIH